MPDPLGGLSAVMEAVRSLRAVVDPIADAKIKLQVAELMNQLADANIEFARMKAENADLKAKLRDAARSSAMEPEVTFRGQAVFLSQSAPGMSPGPYCGICYTAGDGLQLLPEHPRSFAKAFGSHRCKKCDADIDLPAV